jgi:hypothetical protein
MCEYREIAAFWQRGQDEMSRLTGEITDWLLREYRRGRVTISEDIIVAEFVGGEVTERDVRFAVNHIRVAAEMVRC